MKNLSYTITYNIYNHWEQVKEICEIAKSLQPEQTLRVYLNSRGDISDLKHYANKLKQSLFGRIFGWTPLVAIESILTSDAIRQQSVYLDINKHKQRRRVA